MLFSKLLRLSPFARSRPCQGSATKTPLKGKTNNAQLTKEARKKGTTISYYIILDQHGIYYLDHSHHTALYLARPCTDHVITRTSGYIYSIHPNTRQAEVIDRAQHRFKPHDYRKLILPPHVCFHIYTLSALKQRLNQRYEIKTWRGFSSLTSFIRDHTTQHHITSYAYAYTITG